MEPVNLRGRITIEPAEFASAPGLPFPGLYNGFVQHPELGSYSVHDLTLAQVGDMARRLGLDIVNGSVAS